MPIGYQGIVECQEYCAQSQSSYFGFECPKDNQVMCQCAGSFGADEKAAIVEDQRCAEYNNIEENMCKGPFVIASDFGTYFMGASRMNSAYEVRTRNKL